MGQDVPTTAPSPTPLPPFPYRSRPPQVLLAVGAVLLVTAAAALASEFGGALAQLPLLLLAAAAAAASLRATAGGLRSSAETLAACTAGLALVAGTASGPALDGEPVTALVLAGAFLALRVVAPSVRTWPLAAWGAVQLAVLRVFDEIPVVSRTEILVGVALLGLATALLARPFVARTAFVTAAPWWIAGVAAGSVDAWHGPTAGRWAAAALVLVAGVGLVLVRRRREVEPLTGPPQAASILCGAITGAAVTGAVTPLRTGGLLAAGYAGVLLANLAAAKLSGRSRRLLLPVALAVGVVTTALCVLQLIAGREWGALSVLFLLTALPTLWVAAVRPDDRPVALPTAVGCLTGAVLLTLAADWTDRATAAPLLTAVYVVAMAVGSGLDAESRVATARAAAVTGAVAIVLPAVAGERPTLAALLAVQGLATLAWALRTGRRTGREVTGQDGAGRVTSAVGARDADAGEVSAAWRVGAAQLVVAGWTTAAVLDWRALEAWTLPLAAGLLIAAGQRLADGRSWPAYGPGLVVAAVPSTVLAVSDPDGPRPVPVLVVALLVLLVGSRTGVLAPLVMGAVTAVALVLGLTVQALPWPLGTALVAGVVLLAWGTLRERRPVAGFKLRLAELR
jgi:hypothetical protein